MFELRCKSSRRDRLPVRPVVMRRLATGATKSFDSILSKVCRDKETCDRAGLVHHNPARSCHKWKPMVRKCSFALYHWLWPERQGRVAGARDDSFEQTPYQTVPAHSCASYRWSRRSHTLAIPEQPVPCASSRGLLDYITVCPTEAAQHRQDISLPTPNHTRLVEPLS